MKKPLLAVTALLLSAHVAADDSPLWLRYPAISPDGSTIAFTYKGDIFTVPAAGGRAQQITTNAAYDTHPVWSPDGMRIAFASDRMGSLDIYEVSRDGGTPRRLTTHSGGETPVAYLDDTHVLFSATVMPSPADAQQPSRQFPQVYVVSTQGGRPSLFSSLPMEDISVNRQDGRLLYHDRKGYEDPWRKHHTSSITRDIWLCTPSGSATEAANGTLHIDRDARTYTRLTTFAGEDRTPVWTADGKAYYYLSEEDGSFNIYRRTLGSDARQQLTHHTQHPVRFLTAAADGLLCYGFDGEIYTLREGGEPQKLKVSITTDSSDRDVIHQLQYSGAREISLSPDGKEVAFVMHGDVYVTSVEYRTTKQITNTPQQERDVQFSPDGRSLVYASERNGLWQIYQASLAKADEKQFAYATDIREEQLTQSDVTSFYPQYSPDGKEVAFLENRTCLRILNLKTKAVRTAMDGKYEYSYSDGDQWFQWSPDSKWLLTNYIGIGGWNNKDVALVDASGNGQIVNLTESGYSDSDAKWVLDGKAIIWQSDRAGYRSHGSWGAEKDEYIMFLDLDAYERFRLNKEDLALLEESEKKDGDDKKADSEKDKKADDKKDKKGKDKKDADKNEDAVKPLTFDLENRRDRIIRLTVNSSHMGDAVLSTKGDKLYYQASFEGGMDLWEQDLKEQKTRILLKSVGWGGLELDKKGENVYLCGGGGIKKVNLSNGEQKNVDFEAPFDYRPAEERAYIFGHVHRQVADKFYVPDLHGIDWNMYGEAYRRFLPYINNNYDFQELLSEMLGELNGSHTGARYYAPGASQATATLGAFFDEDYTGDGLRVSEVLAKGPFAVRNTGVTAGCIIRSIDGEKILAGQDYFPLLAGKAGRKVRLSVYNPATQKTTDVVVRAISQADQTELLYKRWVDKCRHTVDSLSGGRIGYVHVKAMDSQSFREVYSELLGRCRNKDAVIVDTRHNGGGWLHDDLATLLSGKEYQRFMPRGQYIGSDPFNKWLKPSCVMVCEDNYSNAHGFPWVYKELKIGKLIGAPVPGTMTAVWWETQIDPSLVFGIPQVGCMDMRGQYAENHQLQPDVEVYNSPAKQLRGEDEQLERAVAEMLKEVK
jgi:Tol biopolymer transport system component/C-terminal processing protease CtpA/Prc